MAAKMSEAARKARNEYAKKWRREHPDKERQHHIDYWERKAKEAAERAQNCDN